MEPREGAPPELVKRFRVAALQRTERIEDAWFTLTQRPGDRDLVARLSRDLHALKGDARGVGFFDVNLLCQKLEDLIAAADRRAFVVSREFDLIVTMAIRFVERLLRKEVEPPIAGVDLAGFVGQLDELLDEESRSPRAPAAAPRSPPPEGRRGDRLSRASEVAVAANATRLFVEHLSSTGERSARMHAMWRELSGIADGLGTEPLKPRLAHHIGAAGQLAGDLGKAVHVIYRADDRLIRAGLADALDVAVFELVRNAVDHGIEDETDRVAAGKPPSANLRILVETTARDVTVTVEDDGAGIDLEAVRRRAVELGHLAPDERPAESSLTELLFRPGFSGVARAGAPAGPGDGLRAARAALAAQGATLTLETGLGKGTRAVIRAPHESRHLEVLSFASTRPGLHLAVSAGAQVVVVDGGQQARDPLEVIALAPAAPDGATVLEVVDDEGRCGRLLAGGPPRLALARRLCATGGALPVEVIDVEGEEVLLLGRPALDLLLDRGVAARGARRVLFVDEDPAVLGAARAALEAAGLEALVASDLATLNAHLDAEPDLLVIDVNMPELYGDDVAMVLREARGFERPTLLFSSLDEAELAARARGAGVAGYVCKSAGLDALVERIRSLLG